MGAPAALKQFKQLLPMDTPQYVIWAMGMNNGDRNGKLNSSWLSATEEFLKLCEEYGVTPILCTIPTTPKVNNRLKNAWIESSGYRYIDFDLSVVENHVTGEWFAGMAASDLNHPTTLGAKALYPQVFADFPELAKAESDNCTHKLHLLEARQPECVDGGRYAYYVCSLCAGAFTEEMQPTTTQDMLLAPSGHSFKNCVCTVCGVSGPPRMYGDVDENGEVNPNDAVYILRYAAGLDRFDEVTLRYADANGDGEVDERDAVVVLRHAAGFDEVLGGR